VVASLSRRKLQRRDYLRLADSICFALGIGGAMKISGVVFSPGRVFLEKHPGANGESERELRLLVGKRSLSGTPFPRCS